MHRPQPIAALLVVLATLTACSPTAWDVHAHTAQFVRAGCDTMKAALREHHTDFMAAAVNELTREELETDPEWDARRLAALQDADREWRESHVTWTNSSSTCAETSNLYNESAYTGLQGGGDASAIVTIARRAGRALLSLGDLLRDAHFPDLPDLPDYMRQFVGLPDPTPDSNPEPEPN